MLPEEAAVLLTFEDFLCAEPEFTGVEGTGVSQSFSGKKI